jgi:hypothetical protein
LPRLSPVSSAELSRDSVNATSLKFTQDIVSNEFESLRFRCENAEAALSQAEDEYGSKLEYLISEVCLCKLFAA